MLDLQAAFSDGGSAADTIFSSDPSMVQAKPRYSSSTASGEREDDRSTWRAHALKLEGEAAWLKGQLEAERVSKYLHSRFPFFRIVPCLHFPPSGFLLLLLDLGRCIFASLGASFFILAPFATFPRVKQSCLMI